MVRGAFRMLKPEDVGCQLPPDGPCLGTVAGKLSPGMSTGFPTNTEGGTEPPLQEGLQLQEMGLGESAGNTYRAQRSGVGR